MTTPTELDADYFTKKLQLVIRDIHNYTPDELSRELGRLSETASPAFREAVEAESDAERMKQPAVAWCYGVASNDMYGITLYKDNPALEPLYAQPFPSTEQLQQRVKELTEALREAVPFIGWTGAPDGLADKCYALANTQGDSK